MTCMPAIALAKPPPAAMFFGESMAANFYSDDRCNT